MADQNIKELEEAARRALNAVLSAKATPSGGFEIKLGPLEAKDLRKFLEAFELLCVVGQDTRPITLRGDQKGILVSAESFGVQMTQVLRRKPST
jgi:hypothetical protein